MNVLVIPEDFRKDQYILKPLVTAMLRHLGRTRDSVRVCHDPLLGGVDQALNWKRIEEILRRYQWRVDLFLLIIDRDGKPGRRQSLDNLERRAAALLPSDQFFFGENAWQEVEIFILAGHQLPEGWQWKKIREEVSLKETFYRDFARGQGLLGAPDEGRKTLAERAARNYGSLRRKCPEDVLALEKRIAGRRG